MVDKRYVVCDVDGLVIKSVWGPQGNIRIFTDTFRSLNISPQEAQIVRGYYISTQGHPLQSQYETAIDLINARREESKHISKETVPQLMESYYSVKNSIDYPLYPDIRPAFEEMKSLGWDICLSTSMKQDRLEEMVRNIHGLDKYVDFWYGKGPVKNKKEHYPLILRDWKIGEDEFREKSALAGDSPEDLKVASGWKVRYPILVVRPGWRVSKTKKEVTEEIMRDNVPRNSIVTYSLRHVPRLIST